MGTAKRRFSSGSAEVPACAEDLRTVHDNIPEYSALRSEDQAARDRGTYPSAMTFSLRKEVIQPQVLLRLPCYDFTPIMNYTLGGCSLAVSAPTSSATHF